MFYWIDASTELPAEGRVVIFITESLLCAVGCLQYKEGQAVWYTEFAPWGEFDVDLPLDMKDPESEVTHWMPFVPPPVPERGNLPVLEKEEEFTWQSFHA